MKTNHEGHRHEPSKQTPQTEHRPTLQEAQAILNSLNGEDRSILLHQVVGIQQSSFSGPLPKPEDFAAYRKAVPDAPERILQMAERQQAHRIESERRIISARNKESLLGLILGAFIVFSCIGAAIFLGLHGHDWLAGIIVGIIASVTTIFVLRKAPDNKRNK